MVDYFLGQIDAFDPQTAQEAKGKYAGDICLCVVQSKNLNQAVLCVLKSIQTDGIELKGIDWFGRAAEFEGDVSLFDVTISDLIGAVRQRDEVVFSNAVAYETDQNPEI